MAGRARARGFALPLVAMLILIASIVLALLIQQQAASSLSVSRQVTGYQNHHDASGLHEITSRWMSTAKGKLAETIDPDGLAFRMKMPKSGTVEVRLFDGQGPCMSDTSVLSGRRREIVEQMNDMLKDYIAAQGDALDANDPLTRQAGPPTMSYLKAPLPVLDALCRAVIADSRKAAGASRLLRNREAYAGDKFPVKKAVAALRDQGLSQVELAEIEGMLVDHNTLWLITAEMRDSSGNLYARSGGLYEANDNKQETFNQNAGFLTWDVLPLK